MHSDAGCWLEPQSGLWARKPLCGLSMWLLELLSSWWLGSNGKYSRRIWLKLYNFYVSASKVKLCHCTPLVKVVTNTLPDLRTGAKSQCKKNVWDGRCNSHCWKILSATDSSSQSNKCMWRVEGDVRTGWEEGGEKQFFNFSWMLTDTGTCA